MVKKKIVSKEEKNLNKEEKSVFEEIKKEAISEVAHSGSNNGKMYGVAALIFAISGLVTLLVFPPVSVLGGVFGFIFAIKAERRGFKKLGRIAAIVSLVDVIALVIAFALILSNYTPAGMWPLDPSFLVDQLRLS